MADMNEKRVTMVIETRADVMTLATIVKFYESKGYLFKNRSEALSIIIDMHLMALKASKPDEVIEPPSIDSALAYLSERFGNNNLNRRKNALHLANQLFEQTRVEISDTPLGDLSGIGIDKTA